MRRLIDLSLIGYLVVTILFWMKLIDASNNILKTIYFSKESLFIGILLICLAYREINKYRKISLFTLGVFSIILTCFFIYDYNFKLLFVNYFSGYASLVILILILVFYLLSNHKKI